MSSMITQNKHFDAESYHLIAGMNLEPYELLNIYRTTSYKYYTIEKYTLIDIIGRRDITRLHEYIISGGDMPYIFYKDIESVKRLQKLPIHKSNKHDIIYPECKLKLILTDDERKFVETFFIDDYSYKSYINNLDEKLFNILLWYIFLVDLYDDDDYETERCAQTDPYILNENLRDGFVKNDIDYYKYIKLNEIILNAPRTTKEVILYRGIELKMKDAEMYEKYTGNLILWKAFTSCTNLKEIATRHTYNDGFIFVIICPKNSIMVGVTTIKPSENELILPSNSLFLPIRIDGEIIVIKYVGIISDEGPVFFDEQDMNNYSYNIDLNDIVPRCLESVTSS